MAEAVTRLRATLACCNYAYVDSSEEILQLVSGRTFSTHGKQNIITEMQLLIVYQGQVTMSKLESVAEAYTLHAQSEHAPSSTEKNTSVVCRRLHGMALLLMLRSTMSMGMRPCQVRVTARIVTVVVVDGAALRSHALQALRISPLVTRGQSCLNQTISLRGNAGHKGAAHFLLLQWHQCCYSAAQPVSQTVQC